MLRFFTRRVLLLLVTMFITSMIVFGLTQLLPGDIARLVLGRDASQIALQEFREVHHLTDSVPEQYMRWLGGFVTGDWGISFTRGNPEVSPLIINRLENSARLAALTLAGATAPRKSAARD